MNNEVRMYVLHKSSAMATPLNLPNFPEFQLHWRETAPVRYEKYVKYLNNLFAAMITTSASQKKTILLHYVREEACDGFDILENANVLIVMCTPFGSLWTCDILRVDTRPSSLSRIRLGLLRSIVVYVGESYCVDNLLCSASCSNCVLICGTLVRISRPRCGSGGGAPVVA